MAATSGGMPGATPLSLSSRDHAPGNKVCTGVAVQCLAEPCCTWCDTPRVCCPSV